jgi:hypothetical protein
MNWEVFAKDPRHNTIPNDGVAEVGLPRSEKEWNVLRWELSSFVCEGEYERGLERILSTYLANLDQAVQPAVWVNGFYGSGKSHLVRVLEYLWRDVTFPEGATARSLVTLPRAVSDQLVELSNSAKRAGGLWAATGTLGAGAGDSIRLAILGIVFRAAGLPENYPQGRFVLWLKQSGHYEKVLESVRDANESFDTELNNLYVSTVLANAVLQVVPDFANSAADVRLLFKAQFPNVTDIDTEEMLEVMTSVLKLVSNHGERLPHTLLVLDELQQYVGDDSDRTLRVQVVTQALTKRFGSQLLVVATGQSALQAHPQLQKLRDRFTVSIPLSDADVQRVLRQVVLRKAPAKEAEVHEVLTAASGEIDRQLEGTKLAPLAADRDVLVPDYPLLPVRRRFWERVLRAIDRAGSAGQLRTQLRTVFESTKQVANEPLGTVVPADTIYVQQQQSMLQSGVLLREVFETIRRLDDGTPEGALRSRLCTLIFMISQLPSGGAADLGLHPTANNLADLLVRDLKSDGVKLRQVVPQQLEYLVGQGVLLKLTSRVGDEYRLQTRESSEWEAAYRSALTAAASDVARIGSERHRELREAVSEELKTLPLTHGASKTPRRVELAFSADRPTSDSGVPVWIRDEWNVSDKAVLTDAQAAGPQDATVYVLLPKRSADGLRSAIAGYLAAEEVLQIRGATHLATPEAMEAKNGMQAKRDRHRAEIDAILHEIIKNARVFQGGGNEVIENRLRTAVQTAATHAVARKYHEFHVADHHAWKTVVDRARQGSSDPLAAVGHAGDTKDHPACGKILAYVGGGGKKGSDVRKAFEAPPYGWPREAIDGALLSLMNADLTGATLNGSTTTSKLLDGSSIAVATFKSQSVVLTAAQRMQIRSAMTAFGVSAKSGEENLAVPAFLSAAAALAKSAGGAAPAPAAPDTRGLDEIRNRSGNEQLFELYSQTDRLKEAAVTWQADKSKLEARLPRWQTAQRLLAHARQLAVAEELAPQLAAITEQRSLLQEPDPLPPIINALVAALREDLTNAYKHLRQTFVTQTQQLHANPTWQQLPEQEARDIAARHRLSEPKTPDFGTEADVLLALQSSSISDLENRAAAIPSQVAKALQDAATFLEPKAVPVQPPKTTLKTREEAKAYLAKLEEVINAYLDEDRPVVIV